MSENRGVVATEVVVTGPAPPWGVQLQQRIVPRPGTGQALVAVKASGVNGPSLAVLDGRQPTQLASGFVPGADLVGVVHSVGDGVNPVLVGRQVGALTGTGAWASFVLVSAVDLIPVLDGLDAAEAEVLLIDGLSAWQMLYRQADIRRGQVVLVNGFNTHVGAMLIQLAQRRGARVIHLGPAGRYELPSALDVESLSGSHSDWSSQLADMVPTGVDAIFSDDGQPGSIDTMFDSLSPTGVLVTYGRDKRESSAVTKLSKQFRVGGAGRKLIERSGRSIQHYDLWRDRQRSPLEFRSDSRQDVTQMLDLLARGAITGPEAHRFPLSQAAAAIQHAQSPLTTGKVVLTP